MNTKKEDSKYKLHYYVPMGSGFDYEQHSKYLTYSELQHEIDVVKSNGYEYWIELTDNY